MNAPRPSHHQNLFAGVFVSMRYARWLHKPSNPRRPERVRNYYIPNSNPFVGQTGVAEEFYGSDCAVRIA